MVSFPCVALCMGYLPVVLVMGFANPNNPVIAEKEGQVATRPYGETMLQNHNMKCNGFISVGCVANTACTNGATGCSFLLLPKFPA